MVVLSHQVYDSLLMQLQINKTISMNDYGQSILSERVIVSHTIHKVIFSIQEIFTESLHQSAHLSHVWRKNGVSFAPLTCYLLKNQAWI